MLDDVLKVAFSEWKKEVCEGSGGARRCIYKVDQNSLLLARKDVSVRAIHVQSFHKLRTYALII